MALTPMMQQYMDIKKDYQDCILFFRLGDFYEMFFEDALIASKAMEIALTGKSCGQEERAPMCGVPFHSADNYIAKLIDKGFKVAICEQVEDPATAKGIVKREVVQIVTPGTVLSQGMLKENENNYIASLFAGEEAFGFSYCDISTGEFALTEFSLDKQSLFFNELAKIDAKELLISENIFNYISQKEIENNFSGYINVLQNSYFENKDAEDIFKAQFSTYSIESLGLFGNSPGLFSAVAMLTYIKNTRKEDMNHISSVKIYSSSSHMALDNASLRNLEIVETLYDKKVSGSLLGVMDKTVTAMGARRLKQWLKEPLNKSDAIERRLDAVDAMVDEIILQNNLRQELKTIYDLERLAARISCNNASPRDLLALKSSLLHLPELKETLRSFDNAYLNELSKEISAELSKAYELIEDAINEDAPHTIKDGGIIKSGFDATLDDMKLSIKDGKEWISSLEGKERERTGIKKLKVGYNKVFGYYIEISKSYLESVPENYIRKQTLVNCERFVTEELKLVESKVLGAEAKINQLEYEIFCKLREELSKYTQLLQKAAHAVSIVDVLSGFAKVSEELSYVKPKIEDSYVLEIKNGRHPVIEHSLSEGTFVANDVYLDNDETGMLLITGPNMAGKSTYMRQTALIVLMAQVGCFVPCDYAKIGVVDRIYTRIGASDNLSKGQSTFFVEMNELSYILNTASRKSLILLDEIGRGTSTYDGLSIAISVANRLCKPGMQIRTMFATHYHEMTLLEGRLKGLVNCNVEISESKGEVVFLHKIVKGSAEKSYGIHVAKLAGVPKDVLEDAKHYLLKLEKGESIGNSENEALLLNKEDKKSCNSDEIGKNYEEIAKVLRNVDVMNITPIEAYGILDELKQKVQ